MCLRSFAHDCLSLPLFPQPSSLYILMPPLPLQILAHCLFFHSCNLSINDSVNNSCWCRHCTSTGDRERTAQTTLLLLWSSHSNGCIDMCVRGWVRGDMGMCVWVSEYVSVYVCNHVWDHGKHSLANLKRGRGSSNDWDKVGRRRRECLMGTECQLEMRKLWKWMVEMVVQHCDCA